MGTSHRVWNVAHRGASAERPENTLPAFELAIVQRADVVECDVRATSDGALLLLHDATVNRTTSGTGELRAMTAAQARELDAGEGQRIPELGDVLALAAGRVRVNVNLKEADVVNDAVAVVRAGRCRGQRDLHLLPARGLAAPRRARAGLADHPPGRLRREPRQPRHG